MNKFPDTTTELPEPWYWTDYDFSGQLKIEIGQHHILFGIEAKTIARRHDRDDFLFELEDVRYAFVHLTLQQYPHSDGFWPSARIYENWQDVFVNLIMEDNKACDSE